MQSPWSRGVAVMVCRVAITCCACNLIRSICMLPSGQLRAHKHAILLLLYAFLAIAIFNWTFGNSHRCLSTSHLGHETLSVAMVCSDLLLLAERPNVIYENHESFRNANGNTIGGSFSTKFQKEIPSRCCLCFASLLFVYARGFAST